MNRQLQIDTFLSQMEQLMLLFDEYKASKQLLASDVANEYEKEIEKLGEAEDYASTRLFIHGAKWNIGFGFAGSLRECLETDESIDIDKFITATSNLINNTKDVINKYKAMTC